MKLLADKFIEALHGQQLAPPMYNCTPFILANGFNTKRHFSPHYKSPIDFPAFISSKQGQSILFVTLTTRKQASEEFFKEYWDDPQKFDIRLRDFKKLSEEVDKIYSKMTPPFVQKTSFEILLPKVERIVNAAWTSNAVAFFSLHFDKEFCLQLLKQVNASLTEKRFNEVWDKATIPICDSLEKKHEEFILELIKKETPWSTIIEKCQYFFATYYDVTSLEKVDTELSKTYKREKINDAATALQQIKTEHLGRVKEYEQFLKTLNKEEEKLVSHVQRIIELRDSRKDVTAKASTIMYRVAQRMFKEAGISEKLMLYYTLGELLKGPKNSTLKKDILEEREQGFSVLINYNGIVEFELGTFEQNKRRLEVLHLEQQKVHSIDMQEIKGQTGCRGIVKGVVRIVRSMEEAKKLSKGDILVTGMTRPEFVPLMEKAAAIVTDEGGITCHAAIVSREMGKPCVVGTEIATKVLNDGDLVEVNANHGTVRILKR